MTEIGVTLREARMRAGIDIAEVESRTKIRAKYLRALENEEWNLLPGTTFVKSFLKTYAEMLGLDGKLLVEEYKFRHEPYENGAGGPGVVPRHQGAGRRGRRGGGAFGPPKRTNWLPILVLIVVVLGALFAVYTTSKNEDEPPLAIPAVTTNAEQARDAAAQRKRTRERKARAERRLVKLRIAADPDTTQVYVCVVDATGKKVIDGKQLQPGRRTALLRSKRFKIALNSDAVRITDGGKELPVSAVDGVVAYAISKGQRTPLSPSQRPSCKT